MKTWKQGFIGVLGIFALLLAFTACDDGSGGGGGGSGSIPSELVGEWAAKANPSEMLFKITSDGTFTATGQTGGDFDKISVSGKTVEIKMSGTTVASFDYSISNGEMSISNATSFMAGIALVQPFVKVSGNGSGGALSALVGVWQKNGAAIFEVTSAGKFIDVVNDITYDISVSGNTATLKFGGTTVGTFNYAINDGQMVITSGTGVGMSYAALSPLGKSGGGIPGNPVFLVTFDTNGGTPTPPQVTVVSGSKVTEPATPSKAGFIFFGWSIYNALGTAWDFSTDTVTENITLYAMWMAVATGE